MSSGLCVAIWLLVNLALVGAYDLYAFFALPDDASVSFWLQRWMQQIPALAVAVGVLIGHLSWPIHLRKDL